MEVLWFWLIILTIILFSSAVYWIKEKKNDSEKYRLLKPQLDNLANAINLHSLKIIKDTDEHRAKVVQDKEDWLIRTQEWNKKIQQDKDHSKEEINKIARQKSMGFPWLADAFAEYFSLKDLQKEVYLVNKKHPALSAAELVREIRVEKKDLLRANKIISYKISYYEKLFPWLSELIAVDEEDLIPVGISEVDSDEEDGDRVKNFLTQEEYLRLPSVERNQKALDRYLANRNKSKWQIGRDYEMYIGHLYEVLGYSVEYKGIVDGFDDLGRDIIAMKNGEVCIIQCKYWAQFKEIHEKHVFQLFGTTMEYWINNFKYRDRQMNFEDFSGLLIKNRLRPIFITSASLSDRARSMAITLNVELIESKPIGNFPRIKCNISGRLGEKIYHLPFDQQYDRTIIEKNKGEFFAFNVKEAEEAGFRRAFKHRF